MLRNDSARMTKVCIEIGSVSLHFPPLKAGVVLYDLRCSEGFYWRSLEVLDHVELNLC